MANKSCLLRKQRVKREDDRERELVQRSEDEQPETENSGPLEQTFLGNYKAANYTELMENMITSFHTLRGNMSIKVHYLHSLLDRFPHCLHDVSDEQYGCPNLTGKNVGLLKRMQDKVTEMNPEQKLTFLHCIIHQEVLCKSVLKMNHVVDVVTKTVNFIRARALNHRQFVDEIETEHCDISYHTSARWLSLGKVLKVFWDLGEEILEWFCVKKGNDIPQLSDADWLVDLGFAVDVTAQVNGLNVKLQCKGLFVHEMYSSVKAFMRKLQLLSSQMGDNILTHMPTLKEATPSADHLHRYTSMLEALHGEFSRRFQDFKTLESEMHMVSSPLELIDLQSDTLLAEHFRSVPLLEFYSSLKEENFPHMRRHALRILVLFGSTYTCEQTFSFFSDEVQQIQTQILYH
ncbi:general transcription factor II-I repeat domain-containing protein 2A-like [Pseudophryne corroboree]|uniref:general transcription factor II-I repeat domain-containing protein 2A-like n=1 Tax=Pseudophryne corroboree TaxID=495146 RepID=UPI00308188FC